VTEEGPKIDATRPPYSAWSRNCVFMLYGLAAVWGAIQIVFPDSPGLYLLFTLMFALAATFWARLDALGRSKPIAPILQMLYFLVWPLGAMVYLISRSGWRGLGIAMLHAIGLSVTLAISFYLTFFGLHFAGLLDQRFYQ
jgi:hypothetical protein